MNHPSLTKTCKACGQQKPLSAFLQMSGTKHGTAYGNVCASCRKAAKEEFARRKKTEAEGGTTSETGHRIDSKTKVQDAKDRRELRQKTEEEYHEERKLDEEKEEEKQEKKVDKQKEERKHRETFIKKKQESGYDKKTTDKREAQQRHAEETASREEQHNEAVAAQAHGAHEEKKKTGIDLSVTYQGQQISGSIKHTQNVFLRQFADWLGNSAPIVRNVAGTGKTAGVKQSGSIASPFAQANAGEPVQKAAIQNKSAPKQSTTQRNFLGNQNPSQDQQQKDPAQQYVEKNWRPSGGGRKK